MSFFDELIEKFGNDSDNFVFDATNIDGIYKYLKTVGYLRFFDLFKKSPFIFFAKNDQGNDLPACF